MLTNGVEELLLLMMLTELNTLQFSDEGTLYDSIARTGLESVCSRIKDCCQAIMVIVCTYLPTIATLESHLHANTKWEGKWD